ncbi:MAG: response regulator transcription factor [Azospirillaceae bacterium]|nr:response regulator transcription factor [Azospirillaceae bacterium]
MHILLVEDDEKTRTLVADYLSHEGLNVTTAGDGKAMTEALARGGVDLVLLDLQLPDGDGLALVRELRTQSDIPVIIVTAKVDEIDRVVGLELGADDYLTKPFSPRELLARIKAVLRRTEVRDRNAGGRDELRAVVQFAGWEFDLAGQRLTAPDGREVELTKSEIGLLATFVRFPQRVLSRDQLLDSTRSDSGDGYDRSIDVLILRLRRKIEENPSEPLLIKTERGSGYLFDVKVKRI